MPRIFKKHDIYQGHLLISFGGEEIRSLWYVTLDNKLTTWPTATAGRDLAATLRDKLKVNNNHGRDHVPT